MRYGTRTQGAVTLTQMELRKRNITVSVTGGIPLASRTLKSFNYTSIDYVVDGSLYKITVPHNVGSDIISWNIISTDTNEGLNMTVEKSRQTDTDLFLWFSFDDKNIRVKVL
jgi:hypothetical protein